MRKNDLATYGILMLILVVILIIARQPPSPSAPPPFETYTATPEGFVPATSTVEFTATLTATATATGATATASGEATTRTPASATAASTAAVTSQADAPEPVEQSTAYPGSPPPAVPAATNTPAASTPPAGTGTPTATALAFTCTPNSTIAEIVDLLEPATWMAWIGQLSGAVPVTIDGEETRITTRWTPAMFGPDGETPQDNARAFEYVLETVRGWYPEEQIEVQTFTAQSRGGEMLTAKNLILTLPGQSKAEQVVLLTAHLDSLSDENPETTAPGAEDNGSGSAALLEAARLFQDYRFARTIRIIWFTGEEQGLLGSRAYLEELPDPQNIAGVVNLDMFGFDSDDDGCFELHVGRLPASDQIGRCFVQSAEAYEPQLTTFDYLTAGAVGASDHGSFWDKGIGAVEVLENMFDNKLPDGCANGDPNHTYHTQEDTVDTINPETAIRIVRAALATVAAMAEPAP